MATTLPHQAIRPRLYPEEEECLSIQPKNQASDVLVGIIGKVQGKEVVAPAQAVFTYGAYSADLKKSFRDNFPFPVYECNEK